jgi:hypothetical protein
MKLPGYAVIGLVIIAVSQAGMFMKVEPFWSWHTPIAWTGCILFADGFVLARRGHSWLRDSTAEFVFLGIVSFPLWLIFEFYNLFIRNWHYVNLPASVFWRDLGYVWSFATIWPAIFEMAEVVAVLRGPTSGPHAFPARPSGGATPDPTSDLNPRHRAPQPISGAGRLSIAVGAVMLAWPLVWPSPYLAAPVWLGFIFLLDPINARLGGESIIADYRLGRVDRAANLIVAGLACGILWEFWNYWARTRWIYSVPIFERLKLFEMPLPGYLGFPAFALECFTMYVAVRRLLWHGRLRPVAL